MHKSTKKLLLAGLVALAAPLLAEDSDGDGVENALDNCVEVANGDQRDTNGDGFGNLCDPDVDNDADVDDDDQSALLALMHQHVGPDADEDLNGDEFVNTTDIGILLSFKNASPPRPPGPAAAIVLDSDGDGVPDFAELYADDAVSFARATDFAILSTDGAALAHMHHRRSSVPPSDMTELMAAGLAAGDYDNDGDVDLFVLGGPGNEDGTSDGVDRILRNEGGSFVEDAVALAGLPSTLTRNAGNNGATFVDYDGDGDLDLFVGGAVDRRPILLENEGVNTDGEVTFADATDETGLAMNGMLDTPYTFAATFFDYDNDGDLDLFAPHWGSASREYLWRNEGRDASGQVSFADATAEANLLAALDSGGSACGGSTCAFTANATDLDGNGTADLLIAADFGTSKVLLNKRGAFENVTDTTVITDENGMGAAVGDYDNDGVMDWFVSSIFGGPNPTNSGNRLYRGLGGGAFEDVTDIAAVRDGHWGWGSCFADFNNNARLDLFHVNGWSPPYQGLPARLFLAMEGGTFAEKATAAGVDDTNDGRGISCFDYDDDGYLDVAIANDNGPLELYNNVSSGQNYLKIRLRNDNVSMMNRFGVGARITVTSYSRAAPGAPLTEHRQIREIRAGSHYNSSSPPEAHFGLGYRTGVHSVEVRWPPFRYNGGRTFSWKTVRPFVAANQTLVVDHPLVRN